MSRSAYAAGMTELQYDLVVVGAGSTGENVADRAVKGGMKTLIVESGLVGGECSYWACMPSKALLRSPAVLNTARAVPGAAEAVTGGVDRAAVLRRRDSFTHHWHDDSQVDWLEDAGIDLLRGRARLTGQRRLQVTANDGGLTEVTARHAVALCTGSEPLVPGIDGIGDVEVWTSRDATSANEIPATLAIIGGGVVGVEMATAYSALGSTVTLIAAGGLLAHNEPFAGQAVAHALRDRGVTLLASSASKVERAAAGVGIHTDDGQRVTAERLLVATGRTPGTTGVGLETVGLADGDWLTVDDSMRVLDRDGNVLGGGDGWLYAAGDLTHRAMLTHQGKYDARAAGDAIAARAAGRAVSMAPWSQCTATADHCAVPQVVFSDPEVASVGLTADQAKKSGYRVRAVDYDLGGVAGAAIDRDGYTGHARMVVDEDRGVILGATFVGPDVGELLHAATIAVVGEVPIDRLWHAVPAYPTLSEVWLRLLESYGRPTG